MAGRNEAIQDKTGRLARPRHRAEIVICATQRSGSTLLCEDLRNNGLGRAEEHFLPFFGRSASVTTGDGLDQLHAAATDADDIFAVKIMSSYAGRIDAALSDLGFGVGRPKPWGGLVDYFGSALWIYIDRRGKIEQAVSRAMSRATGINHSVASADAKLIPGRSTIGYNDAYNANVTIPAQETARDVLDVIVECQQWERFFSVQGIQPLRLTYEDLVGDVGYIEAVRKQLQLPAAEINRSCKLIKLSNARSEDAAAAFVRAYGEPSSAPPPARTLPALNQPANDLTAPVRLRLQVGMSTEGGRLRQALDIKALTDWVAETSKRWITSAYYTSAEQPARSQWDKLIRPFLESESIDYASVLDLASGQGRMTRILLEAARHVHAVDIVAENIAHCAKVFAGAKNLTLVKGDGATLKEIGTGSITFAFCFDSMVGFDSDIVRSYLWELNRVLVPGGHAFIHHSNLDLHPESDAAAAPLARSYMSQSLMRHYAFKSGLSTVKSRAINWEGNGRSFVGLDCLTLLRKPAQG